MDQIAESAKKKKKSFNQEFYIQQKCPLRVREK